MITRIGHCNVCGRNEKRMSSSDASDMFVCDDCMAARKRKHHDDHMAARAELPVEERLRLIEEWIYRETHKRTDLRLK